MNKNKLIIVFGICLAAGLGPGVAIAQVNSEILLEDHHVSDERARQIARQTSMNIYNRISLEISEPEEGRQNTLGGSADMKSLAPDVGWAALSYTEISDEGLPFHFDADIYQSTFGIDKRIGSWFMGLSTTYAYTETEFGPGSSQNDNHSISAIPYLAYVFNKNVFINVLGGYTYSKDEPEGSFNSDSETDEYNAELTLNGVKTIDNWFFKGRGGIRYRHTDLYFESPLLTPNDNDQDIWTYLVNGEAGYSFGNGFRVYAGALYEYTETEDGEDDGVLYMNTGIDYSVTEAFSIGVNYSTDANNEDVDIHTVGLNARLAL